ncbi:DUF3592 domain-containing protein [Pontiella agarivorans]|uniref:DUF3592 domain-containing protein n=1 Tax=Pontiella agarivorans TaxID=3038953 RepID=A0ABU5MXP7_9BACT|nr:DUF3592 domain-containing protein [Pontiella agarivorans]MDZ8118846.1 DUF3592 domain-containing protein [Pontiella agarivorans]
MRIFFLRVVLFGGMIFAAQADHVFTLGDRSFEGAVQRLSSSQGVVEIEFADGDRQVFEIQSFSAEDQEYLQQLDDIQTLMLQQAQAEKAGAPVAAIESQLNAKILELSRKEDQQADSGTGIVPSLVLSVFILFSFAMIYFGHRLKGIRRRMENEWPHVPAQITGIHRSTSTRGGEFRREDTLSVKFEYGGRSYKIMSQYVNLADKYIAEDGTTEVLLCTEDPEKSVHYVAKLQYMAPRVITGVGVLFLFCLVLAGLLVFFMK